jgi:O-acetyl-ADP-ribose deacetylase (regulator of RNase III)
MGAVEVIDADCGLRIVQSHQVRGLRVHVAVGSVVDFAGDAIVNAANEGCLSGGGVDGAITDAGGPQLADARRDLPVVAGTRQVRCPTGRAVITRAFGRLRCRWVVHAVGPSYHMHKGTDAECDLLLRSAYASALELADVQDGLRTIAFSLLSSGIYRAHRPLATVLEIGLAALRDVAERAHASRAADAAGSTGVTDVYLVAFTTQERLELMGAANKVLGVPESALPRSPLVQPADTTARAVGAADATRDEAVDAAPGAATAAAVVEAPAPAPTLNI